tara:strand:+ start:126506 stop:127435 length:930 start_codon:yes stop_codon:yes gene_type:complete
MSNTERFYAHGKLLITGEYAVLDGALALAIPCKFGQWLEVQPVDKLDGIIWNSLNVKGDSWFSVSLDEKHQITQTSNSHIANKLRTILLRAMEENPAFTEKLKNRKITTSLEFDRNWGLGSSSTLIHLIAQWAEVDPFVLLQKSFGGSGYDIACADANGPITYKIGSPAQVQRVVFQPSWTAQMHFVYLGKKQVSSKEIAKYSELNIDRNSLAKKVSQLTRDLIDCADITQFKKILQEHENLLSKVLGYPTIQSQLFPAIKGTIKSLGAWGGDFVLFVGEQSELKKIQKMGFETTLTWNEMLLIFADSE